MDENNRCGRRKQLNPRRKNEDDSGVEQDLNDNEAHLAHSSPLPRYHDNPGDDSEAEGSPASCEGQSEATLHVKNQSEAEGESKSVVETGTVMMSDSDQNTQKEPEVTLTHTTPAETGDITDDVTAGQNGDSPGESPERGQMNDVIQRSATAVVYPQPAHHHHDNQQTSPRDHVGPVVDAQHDLDKPPTPTGCLHCEEEFTDLTSLNSHVQTKHAQTPAETVKGNACTQCGASFADKSQFEKHMTLHYPTPQVCKICKKTFANVYRLQRHMISHEESNELRKFKCSECGKAFKFKHHLKEHTRIHSGEKPFECSNCGKRFSHSGSYSSHMTSKKCWVVNMRMSKPGVKTSPEKQQSSPDGLLRPLIPKSHQENGLDINPVTTSSLYPSCVYPPQYMPFDPTGRHLPTQLLNQLCNGNSPFTPPIPYGMINPLLQGQFGISPALIAEQESKIKQLVKAAEKNNHVKAEVGVKVDENQNAETEELKDAVKIKKEKMEEVQENGEDLSEKENEGQDENSLGETPPHMDLDAVKKVLEIVDATVNQQQQQQQIEEKTKLSKLVASTSPRGLSMLATAASEQLKQLEEDEDKSDNKSGSLQCRHCQEICTGPIDLHQHERYLCKNNKDISPSSDREGDKSLCNGSTSPVSSCTERMEDEGDDMEDGQNDRDFKRGRARSFITDEQQTFLRGRYHINPFPSKADLQTIADHTRLAKRVVQVWFQNMRARDRRRGKPLPDMSQVSPGVGSTLATVPTTMPPSSYIPIVPQVSFRSTLAGSSNLYKDTEVKVPTTSQHTSPSVPAYSMPVNINYSMQAEPLDLSVGKQSPQKPGRLHSVKPYHVNDHHDSDEEILNLSTKKHDQEERTSPNPAALEDSPIFRYMKREGILPNGKPSSPVAVPTPVMTSHLVPVTRPLAINTTPAHSSRVCTTGTLSICGPLSEKPVSPDPHITMTSTPLPQHHALHHHQQQQRSPSIPPGSPSVMSSSLDTSYGSSLGLDGSLDSKPPKRARRKSWRQVEAEELHMDFDQMEEDEDDEDLPLRKKRRSWKQHRLEVGDGIYGCDQCDKVFSKQSSLARHKYEHSGQRPFPCDMCGKAFKHKHHLTEHLRLHSGEKPFQCRKCGKRFSHSGSFSQHMNHRYKYCKPLGGTDEMDDASPTDLAASGSE